MVAPGVRVQPLPPKLVAFPGWRLTRAGHRTCFHTLYLETKLMLFGKSLLTNVLFSLFNFLKNNGKNDEISSALLRKIFMKLFFYLSGHSLVTFRCQDIYIRVCVCACVLVRVRAR